MKKVSRFLSPVLFLFLILLLSACGQDVAKNESGNNSGGQASQDKKMKFSVF
ncbi:UNVERIFIED_ORG: hypothetical protein BDK47_109108 [Anoxybacillus amylolyticus]